jgi:hypothetical protein
MKKIYRQSTKMIRRLSLPGAIICATESAQTFISVESSLFELSVMELQQKIL